MPMEVRVIWTAMEAYGSMNPARMEDMDADERASWKEYEAERRESDFD
jgi:hypothetical protein